MNSADSNGRKEPWQPPECAAEAVKNLRSRIRILSARGSADRKAALGISNQQYEEVAVGIAAELLGDALKLAIAEDVIRHGNALGRRGVELEYEQRLKEALK